MPASSPSPPALPSPRSPLPPAALPGECGDTIDSVYSVTSAFGTLYEFDFTSLCRAGGAYTFTNSTEAVPKRYSFNIGGFTSDTCIPYCDPARNALCGANTTYNRYPYAPAIQFVNATQTPEDCVANGPRCFDNVLRQPTCCTAPCETLGIGTPLWSLLDPTNPSSGGVGLTFFGVVPEQSDPYGPGCGVNNATGSRERDVTVRLNCDRSVPSGSLAIDNAYEETTCHYVNTRTSNACGCAPSCNSFGIRMCGSDGCGGFCSGADLAGDCPVGQSCDPGTSLCCRADCAGRDCGDDGCGGSCGTCGADQQCSSAQVCTASGGANSYVANAPISYVSDSSGLAGAFFGGVATVVAAGVFVSSRWGQALLERAGLRRAAQAGAGAERASLISGGSGGGGGGALYAMK